MIITEQLALQIGYKYRFTYENKTLYFRTYGDMLAEYVLLPVVDVQMQEYVLDEWFDFNRV